MRIVKSLNSTKKDTNYAELIDNIVFFEFQVYKTCKTYGVVTLKAHPTIAELIKKKKSESFSKICYVSSLSRTKMSERLSEIFVKCGGKPITITLLRHSYITAFYKDCPNPSIAVKKDLARKMLHSRFVQEVYNVIDLPDEESDATVEEPPEIYTPFEDYLIEPVSYAVDSTVHNRVLEEVLKLNKELLEKTTEIETLKLQIVAMNEQKVKDLQDDVKLLTLLKNAK
jgi:hypothetical protein